MPNAYDWTNIDGCPIVWRTREALYVCTESLSVPITVVKGAAPPDDVSADTHVGGGVIDVRTIGLTELQKRVLLRALRFHFAAWYRYPPKFAEHIHAVCIGDRNLSQGARAQVTAYFNGRDGLASNGPDNWPDLATAASWRQNTTVYPQELEIFDMDEAQYKTMKFADLTTSEEGDTVSQAAMIQNNYRRILRTYQAVQELQESPPPIPTTLTDEQMDTIAEKVADKLAARLAD